MKNTCFVALAMFFSTFAFAKGGAISRGGLGFLFPDNNSFQNAAQFARGTGFALQAEYLRVTNSDAQVLTPSAVFGGKGRWGIGAFGTRVGTDLASSSSADSAGAGLGVALGSSVTLGAGYSRSIDADQSGDGVVGGQLNFNGGKGKGFSVGAAYDTTLNAATKVQTATGAIGYSFKENSVLEAGAKFNNLDSTDDYDAFGAVLVGNDKFYFGAKYTYQALAEDHEVAGRLGFILGRAVDLSVEGAKVLESGSETTYGGTFRVLF